MNEQYFNPQNRYALYWNALYLFELGLMDMLEEDDSDMDNENIGMTMEKLSTYYGMPIEIIRDDLYNMYSISNGESGFLLAPDLDQETDITELPTEERKKLFLSGDLDRWILSATTKDDPYISFSSDEIEAIRSLRVNSKKRYLSEALYIKNSYRYEPAMEGGLFFDNLNTVIIAIRLGHRITFEYRDLYDRALKLQVRPVKVCYDNTDNVYSMLALDEALERYALRFDRIHGEVKKVSKNTPISREEEVKMNELIRMAPQIWGRNVRENPTHVVARFTDVNQTFRHVKAELSYRSLGKLYEKDGYLYYEDDVYGIRNFTNYILSYGSAAVVVEPKKLRESMIETLKKGISYYEKDQ